MVIEKKLPTLPRTMAEFQDWERHDGMMAVNMNGTMVS